VTTRRRRALGPGGSTLCLAELVTNLGSEV
jgi:hypothetical protein